MPIIKSAQKKLRQDKLRTARNIVTKRAYKDAVKEASQLAESGKKIAQETVSTVHAKIDKAAKKNLIHQNKAARLKSRVSKLARGNK